MLVRILSAIALSTLLSSPTQAATSTHEVCPTRDGIKIAASCGECWNTGKPGWRVYLPKGGQWCNPCNTEKPSTAIALSAYEPPSTIGGPKRTGSGSGRYVPALVNS